MNNSELKNRLHIGMRNIKTGISVFVCLLIYRILDRDGYFLACTAAVICMQDTMEKSFANGINRCAGTLIGAALGTCLLLLDRLFPSLYLAVVTSSIGVVLLIALCNLIGKPEAIVIGCVVLLAITLEQAGQSPLVYGLNRLLDTFIGILVAIAINRFIRNPDRLAPAEEPTEELT